MRRAMSAEFTWSAAIHTVCPGREKRMFSHSIYQRVPVVFFADLRFALVRNQAGAHRVRPHHLPDRGRCHRRAVADRCQHQVAADQGRRRGQTSRGAATGSRGPSRTRSRSDDDHPQSRRDAHGGRAPVLVQQRHEQQIAREQAADVGADRDARDENVKTRFSTIRPATCPPVEMCRSRSSTNRPPSIPKIAPDAPTVTLFGSARSRPPSRRCPSRGRGAGTASGRSPARAASLRSRASTC